MKFPMETDIKRDLRCLTFKQEAWKTVEIRDSRLEAVQDSYAFGSTDAPAKLLKTL